MIQLGVRPKPVFYNCRIFTLFTIQADFLQFAPSLPVLTIPHHFAPSAKPVRYQGQGAREQQSDQQMKTQTSPRPTTVRLMTDADCQQHGISREDYPEHRLYLAVWPDRSGFYTEDASDPIIDEARFCATVFNESEIFATHEEAQAWLYDRLETSI